MKAARFRWGIVGVLFLALVAVGLYAWPRYLSPSARLARSRGYDPVKYSSVKSLQMQAVRGEKLTAADIARLEGLACDQNPFIAARALTALQSAAGSDQEKAAQDIARDKLSSDHPLVRLYALSTLAKLRASDTREYAERMLKDPNVDVRKAAERILAKPS
ncbi:MAG: HEAT repeat domain-containing protein [Chthonomonadales bacterium]|nr:HEAT repeat domain-containing protein [Chthonomonadales bacterium]